jgi:hypothetical protein
VLLTDKSVALKRNTVLNAGGNPDSGEGLPPEQNFILDAVTDTRKWSECDFASTLENALVVQFP